MTQDYVILRATAAHTHEPFNLPPIGPFALPTPPIAQVAVELKALSAADVLQVAAEPDVRGLAPRMPTKLIRPVDHAGAGALAVASTWGLAAVKATGSSRDGAGVKVAVLDTGIDRAHPAFAGIPSLVERDFSGSGNGDVVGHGTHCAGTIFGRAVNGQRIGVAPGVTDVLIGKVLDNTGAGDTLGIVDGVLWAVANGADVISMSLGFDFPGMVASFVGQGLPQSAAVSQTLVAYRANLRLFDRLIELLAAGGPFGRSALVVAASGNESQRPAFTVDVSLPAAATGVIAVGAAGQPGLTVARFSNSNPQVCGPGVDVLSARAGGGLIGMSGTSMATPHVAGVAALHWQDLGLLAAPTTVAARLLATARPGLFVPPASVADIGAGLVTAPA
jgi:subtilisin family serine protease